MFASYPIIRTLTTFIFPYIVLYALYIQLNGEVSPGGGFQAGVIFASALIGIHLVLDKSHRLLSIDLLLMVATLGVLIYAVTGLVSLYFDKNYLNYYSLIDDKTAAQSLGIMIIEVGVGLTVSAVMTIIYLLFYEE